MASSGSSASRSESGGEKYQVMRSMLHTSRFILTLQAMPILWDWSYVVRRIVSTKATISDHTTSPHTHPAPLPNGNTHHPDGVTKTLKRSSRRPTDLVTNTYRVLHVNITYGAPPIQTLDAPMADWWVILAQVRSTSTTYYYYILLLCAAY
jgi:hypothetical protein